MNGRFVTSCEDGAQVEHLIEPGVREQVQRGVEEGEAGRACGAARIGHVQPKSVLSGVHASDASRSTSAEQPELVQRLRDRVRAERRRARRARRSRRAARARPTRTPGLEPRRAARARRRPRSPIRHQKLGAGPCRRRARDLLGVAVEGQRRAARELADAALGRLAPARVVDRGIHVGVEAVLVGRGAGSRSSAAAPR